MKVGDRLMNHRTMMRLGMLFLVLGSLAHWFLRPATPFGQDLADGAFGLLYGLSIGSLIVSLRLRARRCPGD